MPRALHAAAADLVVPDHGDGLRPPGRRCPRMGHLAGHQRSCRPRRRDDRDAYSVQIVDPVDRLISWLDEVQVGAVALQRVLGVELVPDDRVEGDEKPRDEHMVAEECGSPIERAGTCCTASASTSCRVSGSRSSDRPVPASPRWVDSPASTAPTGASPSAACLSLSCPGGPAPSRRARHPGAPRLRRSLAENLLLARPEAGLDALRDALALSTPLRVDARPRAWRLPSDRVVIRSRLPRRSRSRWPGWCSLTRTPSYSTRPPRCSTRAPRLLERSLGAVLAGRTVVAIAHRLHTAHDAHRVAVVDGGRITELGSTTS